MTDWLAASPAPDLSQYLTASHGAYSATDHALNGSLPWQLGDGAELDFSLSPTKPANTSLYGSEQDSFCSRNTVDDCVAYLNQEVMMLGLPSLYETATGTFDIVRLVNVTHELLTRISKNGRLREELEDRLSRSECDKTTLQETVTRLKDKLDQLERDLGQSQEKERQVVMKNASLTNKLKAEKEEVKRLNSVMAQRDAQYRHEVRKKEREAVKLKDRLHHLLSDKNQERKVGMEISQTLLRPDGKRARWNTNNKHEHEMYRTVISDYEDRQKQLLVENSKMRECLVGLQKDLVAMMRDPNTPAENTSQMNLEDLSDSDGDSPLSDNSLQERDTDHLSEGHFEMPYTIVRDGIEKSLKAKFHLLKRHIRQIEKQRGLAEVHNGAPDRSRHTSSQVSARNQRELEKLRKQTERYKEIIEQQEEFIHVMQQNLENPGVASAENSILRDSYLWEEWESLQRDKRHFKLQKGHLEAEKKNITDARVMLEKQRREFEADKACDLKHSFLHLTPFHGKSQRPRRLLPSTPIFSPEPSSSSEVPMPVPAAAAVAGVTSTPKCGGAATLVTPTTVELYRTLGLMANDNRSTGSHRSSRHSNSGHLPASSVSPDTSFCLPDHRAASVKESSVSPRSVESSGPTSARSSNGVHSAEPDVRSPVNQHDGQSSASSPRVS